MNIKISCKNLEELRKIMDFMMGADRPAVGAQQKPHWARPLYSHRRRRGRRPP